jgi:hypothetical protein
MQALHLLLPTPKWVFQTSVDVTLLLLLLLTPNGSSRHSTFWLNARLPQCRHFSATNAPNARALVNSALPHLFCSVAAFLRVTGLENLDASFAAGCS